MKKLLAIVLVATMSMSLAACSVTTTNTAKESAKSVAETIIEISSKVADSAKDAANAGFVPSPTPYDTPTPVGPDSIFVPTNNGSERQELLNYGRMEFGIKYVATEWTHTSNANVDIWSYDRNEDIVYFVSREYMGLSRQDIITKFLVDMDYTINIESDGTDADNMILASDGDNVLHFFCTDSGLVVASIRPQENTEWQNFLDTILRTFVPAE